MSDKPYIGGQAVIEGVMMRGPSCMSVAVRRPDGSIAVDEGPLEPKFGPRLSKLPLVRGVLMLVESLTLGMRALNFSARHAFPEEEASSAGSGRFTALVSIVIALAIFIALPQGLATGLGRLLDLDLGLSDASFHALTGAFKLGVFLAYLFFVRRIPEMRRVFQYHGAEHKTIHAYEAGLALTPENVRAQSTLHPRCGTTFLVVVILVSIVLGSIVTPIALPNAEGLVGQAQVLALRIGLLPVIAAVSYEFQRFSARYCTRGPLRALLLPGFLFQKITTIEPDDAQIEIAIAALDAARWRETTGREAPAPVAAPMFFPDFDGFREALPSLRG
jgi:uncharacterized protein YqhQ